MGLFDGVGVALALFVFGQGAVDAGEARLSASARRANHSAALDKEQDPYNSGLYGSRGLP